ncbi:primosomal protein N' [Microcella daejeonensis]|uniref:primosomal protein N' family DNA-binding protein n=1 Tax=Microcella daejeonensis TaxID=2994971 RepID=UPI002271D5FF|nr:primosomal protein N' [Microcella daejeonensis]WAB83374.1 primosomal protein N' [Microcella daejeonensis]
MPESSPIGRSAAEQHGDGATAIARVLLDSPLPQLDRLFDYRIPPRLRALAVPGVRVTVPLRAAGRQASGYLIEVVDEQSFEGVLSELVDVVSAVPVLRPEVYRLIRRAADRAAGTASDLARLVIPTRQVRVEKAWLARRAAEQAAIEEAVSEDATAADAASEGPAAEDATSEGPAAEGPAVTAPVVLGYDPAAIDALLDPAAPGPRRRVALTAIPEPAPVPDPDAPSGRRWMPAAARTLAELAAATLARGRSAIVSVPDYRDLENVAAALTVLVPADGVARVDAGQSNPDRYRGFLRALEPRPVIVLGMRTAVAAPAHDLGLIALWDDGDGLHVEPHAPGVHTRDLALLRQEDSGAALVLASHARTTDVQRLVEVGYVGELAPTPARRRRITPTAQLTSADGPAARARIPSTAWRTVAAALDEGPVLVQVARPGYAPRLACADCGETARCTACQGPIAQKRQGATPACQWCGALAVEWRCNRCEGERWRTVGSGSGRTADELGRAFPGARIIVADGEAGVQHVPAGRTLVVATRGAEPVAEGGYRAVLLLDGERMLARESLRVVEDCVRWWCTAAALAAPDAPVMLVGVGGAVASALAMGQPERIAAEELADRRLLRFPPAVRVAAMVGEPEQVARASAEVAALEGVDVLGPVELDEDRVRAIVRFDYARGAEVAETLKVALIRSATAKPRRVDGRPPRRRVPGLRVRFDDHEPFDDPAPGRPAASPARAADAPPSGRMGG